MEEKVLPVLQIRNLSLSYNGNTALTSVDVVIPSRAMVSVVGPNGAGKSTLFKVLAGLLNPDAGEVLVGGEPLRHRLKRVAYVPQRQDIDWRFPVTLMDVVLMGRYGRLGWLRRPGRTDRAVARHWLAQLGLDHLVDRQIGELSGGQQQRVFLARALAQEPDILLLDEPFAGVDVPTQEAVLSLLANLGNQNITVLVSTHDLPMATSRFAYLMLLNRRLIAFGPPAEVLTPSALSATFGEKMLISPGEEGFMAMVDHCCPCPVGAEAISPARTRGSR